MDELIQAVTPTLLAVIGAVLTYLLNRVAGAVQAATGITIERNAREALHSAIMTGVKAALSENPAAEFAELKRQALAYAYRSVPDAIALLMPGDGVLDDLAKRYVSAALAELAGAQAAN